jgi:zinc protease
LLGLAATGAVAAEFKNRAPVSRESLVVKMPFAEPVKLANGVTLIALADQRLPIATITFRIESAGPIYSTRPGIAEMTADMLREGAAGRTGKQIIDEAARLGATLASVAPAGAETAAADGLGLTSRWPEWFELLSNIVMRPTFPADEFTSLKQRSLVGLRIRRAQPNVLAGDTLMRLIFGNHPAGAASPPPEALAALTPEMLAAFHRERYTPANTVVLCVGRVKPSAFHSRAEKLLGGWKGGDFRPAPPPPPVGAGTRRIVLIDRPGAAQTELVIGNLLFDRRDPDFFPTTLLNSVLGGLAGSRLFQILREEKGYAFQASSSITSTRFGGFWRVRAAIRTDATADSLAIILEQLRRMCEEPVPAEELDGKKRAAAGWFATTLEQPETLIANSYLVYRYGFASDYWERFPMRLNAVTPAEIQAVAQKYYRPDRAHIVAVGDAAKIRPALAKLGNIES